MSCHPSLFIASWGASSSKLLESPFCSDSCSRYFSKNSMWYRRSKSQFPWFNLQQGSGLSIWFSSLSGDFLPSDVYVSRLVKPKHRQISSSIRALSISQAKISFKKATGRRSKRLKWSLLAAWAPSAWTYWSQTTSASSKLSSSLEPSQTLRTCSASLAVFTGQLSRPKTHASSPLSPC